MSSPFLILFAVVMLFGFVLLFGAPYLPTLSKQKEKALDLIDLQKGQTMLELGCGDGRVLRAAAKRGWNCVGYELNPLLALVAWFYTWRYRNQVKIILGNFWVKKWPRAEGIFVFLLPKYMEKLDNKITQEFMHAVNSGAKHNKTIKLVSYAFAIPGKQIKTERSGLYLYEYRLRAKSMETGNKCLTTGD